MNILVTGGASGLGEAITRKLASDKANQVYFTFCKSVEGAKNLEKNYPNTIGIQCDFTSPDDMTSLAEQIPHLKIQALINNAMAGLEICYFHKHRPESFVHNFQKNIFPVIRITQAAITHFRKQRFGKIITILSDYMINKPPVGLSEYVASKSYLLSLSKSWATENSSFNISSNCISPSFMLTSLNKDTDERIVEEITARHPFKTLLKTEEVADTVSYLMKSTQQINGINLLINGGQNVI